MARYCSVAASVLRVAATLEVVQGGLRCGSLHVHPLTFISFAGCGRLWSFREARIPDAATLQECLAGVDFRRIELDTERRFEVHNGRRRSFHAERFRARRDTGRE